MKVASTKPSNIALIKYMGKTNSLENIPANASLSYTLSHLQTKVVLESSDELKMDRWSPLEEEGWVPPTLTEKGREKFLKHLSFLKQKFGLEESLQIYSGNNFPADAGLASSASSFAALTQAVFEYAKLIDERVASHNWLDLAKLSQRGSGSSCRSFCGPFALWSGESIREMEFKYNILQHQVVLVDVTPKRVSSSQAHARVVTSLLFEGRRARAENRLSDLISAFNTGDWQRSFEICWAEFWDMHALFETAQPPFSYMKPKTLEVLEFAMDYWNQAQDGPLVTMDAGANVHFLFREDQQKVQKVFSQRFSAKIDSFEMMNL